MSVWIVISALVLFICLAVVFFSWATDDRTTMAYAVAFAFLCWTWPVTLPVVILVGVYKGIALVLDELFGIELPKWRPRIKRKEW